MQRLSSWGAMGGLELLTVSKLRRGLKLWEYRKVPEANRSRDSSIGNKVTLKHTRVSGHTHTRARMHTPTQKP